MKHQPIDYKKLSLAAFSRFSSTKTIQKMGRFPVDALLYATNLHECYRIYDAQVGKPLFLKILLESAHAIEEQRSQLFKEAQILSAIEHPYIAKYQEHGRYEGRAGLITHYYDGITLRQFLKEENPSIDEAFFFLQQLASALDYLHRQKILHGDLKPENILILPQLELRLVDFGIARLLGQQIDHKVQQLAGTLLYMSPEQQNQADLSQSSDLYSFAIIAFELLTGRLSHGLVKLASLPHALQKTFAKALSHDPQARFPSAMSFVDALRVHKNNLSGKISAQIRPATLAHRLLSPPLQERSSTNTCVTVAFTAPPHFWPLSALWLVRGSERRNALAPPPTSPPTSPHHASPIYALMLESGSTQPESYIALHRVSSLLEYYLDQLYEEQLAIDHFLAKVHTTIKELLAETAQIDLATLSTHHSSALPKRSLNRTSLAQKPKGSALFLTIDLGANRLDLYPLVGDFLLLQKSKVASSKEEESEKKTFFTEETLSSSAADLTRPSQSARSLELEQLEALWIPTSHMPRDESTTKKASQIIEGFDGTHQLQLTERLCRELSEHASLYHKGQLLNRLHRVPRKVAMISIFPNVCPK